MKDIITQIEYLRLKLGYSKRKLSGMAGITEEYYWRIVTGKAPGCSYSIIQLLCDAVNLRILTYVDPLILENFNVTKN